MDARLPDAPESVTDRQREVARLIAEGKTNPQIADVLGITLDGAKYHVSELLGRLGLERREEVADWYRRHHGWRTRLRGLFTLPLGALALGGTVAAVTLIAVVAVVAVIVATRGEATTGRLRAPGTIEEVAAPPEMVQQGVLVALPDGSALLLGGWPLSPGEPSGRAWRFDPRTNRWRDAGSLVAPLLNPVVMPTADGIVVSGGRTPSVSPSATSSTVENQTTRIYRLNPGGLEEERSLPNVGRIAALAVRPDGSMDALIETRRANSAASFHVRHWADEAWEPITGAPYDVDDPFRRSITLPDGSFAVISSDRVAVIDPTTGSHIEVALPEDGGLGIFPTPIGLLDGRIALFGGLHREQWQAYIAATTDSMQAARDLPAGDPTPMPPLLDVDATDGVLIVDPATGRVDQHRLPAARVMVAASGLPVGRVLLVGGVPVFGQSGSPPGPTWVFDPDSGMFEELPALEVGPLAGSTVTLADGSVLILGLFADSAISARTRAYLYQP